MLTGIPQCTRPAIWQWRAEDLERRRHREARASERRFLQLHLHAEEDVTEPASDWCTRLACVVDGALIPNCTRRLSARPPP